LVNIVVASVGYRIGSAAGFLLFIASASAPGAGNVAKHRNNAHQPARDKWYRCSADRRASSWPSIHRPE
jgi:hypothetical protein